MRGLCGRPTAEGVWGHGGIATISPRLRSFLPQPATLQASTVLLPYNSKEVIAREDVTVCSREDSCVQAGLSENPYQPGGREGGGGESTHCVTLLSGLL